MGPTTAEFPTRARGNKCGTVTGRRDATVVLSHPSAAAHAASSARGCRLKRRAHTVPHKSGQDARYRRKTRTCVARGSATFSDYDEIFLHRVSLPSKESHFEALLIRGSKPGPSGGSIGAPDHQSQALQGCAVQATLERGVRDILRSVQGQSRVPRRGISSRESIEPLNPTEWVRAPSSAPSRALYETCLWTTIRPLSVTTRPGKTAKIYSTH